MPRSIAIHDARLKGQFRAGSMGLDFVMRVSRHDALEWAFLKARGYAQAHGGLGRLIILCHGHERVITDETTQESVIVGGFGLQLCREGLNNRTVRLGRILRGHVQTIVVYACAAADTHGNFQSMAGDGQLLCRELAAYTNATVYASAATQYYAPETGDFGVWEGQVFRFTPQGERIVVESNPL